MLAAGRAECPPRQPHAPLRGRFVNKMDLIAVVAEETQLPRAKASEVVDAVFAAIEKALKEHQEVRLAGFGTFATAQRKVSSGRNPRTGGQMDIPASISVRF